MNVFISGEVATLGADNFLEPLMIAQNLQSQKLELSVRNKRQDKSSDNNIFELHG